MAEFNIHFYIHVTPRAARGMLAGVCLCLLATEVSPESVTLNTYYPAPSGIYVNMITTGNAYLARDGGRVGIGTTNPQAALDVNGTARIGNFPAAPPTPCASGALYYDTTLKNFQGCVNGAWQSLAGGGMAGCAISALHGGSGTATCPAGTHAVSGGCYQSWTDGTGNVIYRSDLVPSSQLNSGAQLTSFTGYSCWWQYGKPSQIVYAVCCP